MLSRFDENREDWPCCGGYCCVKYGLFARMHGVRLAVRELRFSKLVLIRRNICEDQNEIIYNKYLDILKDYTVQERQTRIVAPNKTVFDGKSLKFPTSKCIVENFDVSCERIVHISDTIIPHDPCHRLCGIVQHSDFEYLLTSPGERKISTNISSRSLESLLSLSGLSLIGHIKQTMQKHAKALWGKDIKEAGSILSWLTSANVAFPDYTEVHCDQLNNHTYDYTLICYLSSSQKGGNFVFMDEDIEYHVEPRVGRLLGFESSIVNIHRVMPVLSGNRFALSMWFSNIKK